MSLARDLVSIAQELRLQVYARPFSPDGLEELLKLSEARLEFSSIREAR